MSKLQGRYLAEGAIAVGSKSKDPVVVRAQGNVTLAAPGGTIDGETMSVDNRVCCDQQSTTTEDGLYLWKGFAVPMVQTDDASVGAHFAGATFFVEKGTDAERGYECSNNAPTDVIGTDDIVIVRYTVSLDVANSHKFYRKLFKLIF